jgi:predicted ATPase/class 3 adenylate cyclase
MRRDLPAGTVTFLFTDVEGSTKLLHEFGAETYAEKLSEHRRVVREACTARGGAEVDTQGDAFFLAFPTAPGALEAARSITEELASGPIALRIGLHTGAPLLTEEGYVGEEVHFAARVAASAHGGQVVLSQATRTLLEDRYPLVELGEHRLKDIPGPVAIYQLGDGTFPPLKTISNTNLPRPASSFVGRERELRELLAFFESGVRLVTVSGPGGSGKTRLALEVAATLVPEYRAGVFWVGLASLRDATLVTETIQQALGAKDGLADHIGERQMLLFLDNLEQVIEAARELAALLASCPNLTILVTSRELLRVRGEIEYPVPPLAETEAVSLFCERAQTAASEEIAELCRRLDNLPLAVELAAARAKALSPAQLLERLSQRLDLLKGGRDADPRQQTLRATIAWSYELLSAEEQRLFGRLTVFAGGCTLGAAEEVVDADLDTLQSLVEKSLLRFSNERYWMLETIREYSAECLCPDDRERFSQRHGDHYLALLIRVAADESEALQPAGIRLLAAELDNLRAARVWFHDTRQSDAELHLVCALADFWVIRGHLREARSYIEAALENDAPQSPVLRANALVVASDFARLLGAVEQGRRLSEESLSLFRQLGDNVGAGRALHELGEAALDEEDYDRAVDLFDEAITVAREAGKDGAGSIGNLGFTALLQGDYERAAALSEEALALFRQRRQTSGVLVALGNLAEAELRLGRQEEARRHLAECLELAREAQFLEVIAQCLETAAALLLETGDAETAARLAGAEDGLLEQISLSLHPGERRRRARLRADLRALLRNSADELRDEGRGMTADDASTLALEAL